MEGKYLKKGHEKKLQSMQEWTCNRARVTEHAQQSLRYRASAKEHAQQSLHDRARVVWQSSRSRPCASPTEHTLPCVLYCTLDKTHVIECTGQSMQDRAHGKNHGGPNKTQMTGHAQQSMQAGAWMTEHSQERVNDRACMMDQMWQSSYKWLCTYKKNSLVFWGKWLQS